MAIRRMINTRSLDEVREFQTRMIPFGRIRTGVFETPSGKRGRPAKLDRFRFTSPDRDVIKAVAEEYGGTVEEFVPQGNGKRGWQVTSDADRIPVYLVNGQKIDPTYEAWAVGGRCIRRCDGEWDVVSAAPCVCNGLHPDQPRPTPRDMCKMTTRVNLMLPVIEGIGTWLYESHGENFAIENGGVLAKFVAGAEVAVPAWFCLEQEVRQYRKDDGGFERREFYVARFRVTALTPEQIALGGDVVSRILMEAGAPAALSGGPRPAIEAAIPVSAVPATEAPAAEEEPAGISPTLRSKILADIEAQTTVEGLDGVKAKLIDRGIADQQVKDAWKSKRAAVVAAEDLLQNRQEDALNPDPEYQVGDTVTVGGIEFTKIGENPFEAPVDGDVEDGDGSSPVLPMIPNSDYDAGEVYTSLIVGAGKQDPPLTTNELNRLIRTVLKVDHHGEATGVQLARLRAALKAGTVFWR
jgi:hypothetical protein